VNNSASPIGPLLQAFFSEHLVTYKRASPQTVIAYRDTFRLLLLFVRRSKGIEPAALRVSDLDATTAQLPAITQCQVGCYPLVLPPRRAP
jgi:hypothetical protein